MPDPAQADAEAGEHEPGTSTATRVAPRPGSALAGGVALVLLAGLWSVWAWQDGGWFGTALYPGVLILAAGVILLALFAPERLPFRGWPALALAGLIALGCWSALSAVWSPSPDVAIEDAQRILAYAMAFGIGLWLCALLRPRFELALAPIALAGLFAGVVAVVAMLTSSEPRDLLEGGTLEYPIGYRNANAAFFLIALWPAVGLAAARGLDWRLRALALAAATLCLELGMLSQSRGSIIAAAFALAVYLLVSRDRARAVGWLLLAVVPALVVVPGLTDLYDTAKELGPAPTIEALAEAGRSAALGAVIALALGAVGALLERRYLGERTTLDRANRAVAVGAVALGLAGIVGFVVATGDPVEWVGDRVDEFQNTGSPSQTGSSRFEFNAGTERDDLWRVALDDAGDSPLLGEGGGGFHYSYLRNRSADGLESVHDAHSVEFEILDELGLPGLALFAIVMVAAAGGALSARKGGLPAAALSGCALTAGAYWLGHASIDWFWAYPAVTAPVLALLGSASAPAVVGSRAQPGRRGRWLIVSGVVLVALSVIPPYLSESYVNAATEAWSRDPDRAFDDLDRASALNPLAEEPMLTEGAIARELGDRAHAIDAFERAAEKRPEDWASHYLLAQLYARQDPARARRELDIVARQNPLSARLKSARRRLDSARPQP